MDSQHRHELKENDLMEFLRNFKEWFNKYGTQVLLVILIAVLAYVGVNWFTGREMRQRQAAWAEYAASATPEGLAQLGDRYSRSRPGVAAMSLLDAADLLRREAVLGIGPDAQNPTASGELTDDQRRTLEQAANYYQRVIDMPGTHLLYQLNAHMGLAATQVSLGDREAAREHYRAAMQASGPYQQIRALAQMQMSRLDQLPARVAFAVKPPDAETPEGPDSPMLPDTPEGDPEIRVPFAPEDGEDTTDGDEGDAADAMEAPDAADAPDEGDAADAPEQPDGP